ncbi:AMP-binding protein [Actinoallomurus rhizosphaericola]|uniref:AMP-binding protein n=1 Tax=Actinoallomurus rhizosphaericola TaxID=2952536 RepID=UPI0020924DB6|nr:AMP-binding protein [Actinoallomurus rhizosphaericola]MCO5998447.1 AMP-binding protein [Actinoallomurus rhizosphaericola]
MPDWTISTTGTDPAPAQVLAEETYLPLTRPTQHTPSTYLLHGSDQARIAAAAQATLQAGHRLVLLPGPSTGALPDGIALRIDEWRCRLDEHTGGDVRSGWNVAMFTSGSTGTPRGYGFTRPQLDRVTAWYEQIYRVTKDSILVTALPAAYNFTFVAGVLLAARLGARLHLSRSLPRVLHDAKHLAGTADRLVVLANPVILDQAQAAGPLPRNVLVDSGGAPLSTTAAMDYRNHGIDLREGYGLTETASLTHFDTDAGIASVGTVGVGMPSVRTVIDTVGGAPVVEVASPAIGVPLDHAEPAPGGRLLTTDLGRLDDRGRLRLLGRIGDEQIGGLWPRDTLDVLGPFLRRRSALVRHHTGQATIRLLAEASAEYTTAIQCRAADALGISPDDVFVTSQGPTPLLHSVRLTRSQPR